MINSVRNTVLSVLNKNNYGYISPSDFNLYAKQAQMELYEEYFSNYNKAINMENVRQVGTDYADISKPLAEVLDAFLVYDFLFPVISPTEVPPGSGIYPSIVGKFYAPTSVALDQNLSPALSNMGGEAYMINRLTCWNQLDSGLNTPNASGYLLNSSRDFSALGVKPGDFILNLTNNEWTTVLEVSTTNFFSPNDTLVPSEPLFTGGVSYRVYSSTEGYDPERVTNGNIRMLNSSLLTKPNSLFPAYTQDEIALVYNPQSLTPIKQSIKSINLYPNTLSGYGALYCAYFRYPLDPKWTYITLSSGEPVFDQTAIGYQDFEMPLEDEYKLTMKILQYCGVSIREAQVVQFAMAQEQHEQPSFSVQQ